MDKLNSIRIKHNPEKTTWKVKLKVKQEFFFLQFNYKPSADDIEEAYTTSFDNECKANPIARILYK